MCVCVYVCIYDILRNVCVIYNIEEYKDINTLYNLHPSFVTNPVIFSPEYIINMYYMNRYICNIMRSAITLLYSTEST